MYFLFLWLWLFPLVLSSKLLVWSPTISRSHMISNGRIADTLARAGHDVPDFLGIFDQVNSSRLARRWKVDGFSDALHKVIQGFSGDVFEDQNVWSLNKGLLDYERAYNGYCQDLINRDDLMTSLRSESFDGFFGEQINLCGNGLAHALGIRAHFWISSCPISDPMAWIIGMPNPFSYVPAMIGVDMDTRPSYWQRANNLLYGLAGLYHMKIANDELTEIFRLKYGQSFPSVDSIAADSDVIFVATDEFLDFPRPTLPHIVHIGGLGMKEEAEPLDEVFSHEMARGNLGVAYFSFGTIVNTSTLPQFAMSTVFRAIAAHPEIHFIVRVDKQDIWSRSLAEKASNVFLCHWTPQAALLRHPRLLLFISHAGYNSLLEAAGAAVPLVTIPFLFDQTRNSRAVQSAGWGIHLPRQSLRDEPELLTKAVGRILEDKSFKSSAVRTSRLMRLKPFSADDRLIRMTNFVLEMGGVKEWLVEGRRLDIVRYFNGDIIVPIIVILLAVLYVVTKIAIRVIRLVGKCLHVPVTMQKKKVQ